jgi:hypothetical protein
MRRNLTEAQIKAALIKLEKRVKAGGLAELRPQDVVDAARDPKHILHDQFTWDDAEAAERYRLMQARELLRIKIHVTIAPGKITRVALAVRTPTNGGHQPGYVRTDLVQQQSVNARLMLDREVEGIGYLVKRGRNLAALKGLSEEFETLLWDKLYESESDPKPKKRRRRPDRHPD